MNREALVKKLESTDFDLLVLGGGATGAGTALDASQRGLRVALLEKQDFSQGTSSRSTKLIHGGVRYLAQFHFKLIREALSERKHLLENAPHLVSPLPFVLPTYSWYEKPYFSLGMTLYDFLAGRKNLPWHRRISKAQALEFFPGLKKRGLKGGILYYDAQFNDARLNLMTVLAAENQGACVANRMEVLGFEKTQGKITGAQVRDFLTGKDFPIRAKVVANTTGVWIDSIRQLDDPSCQPVLAPSQGIHLVFSQKTIPCSTAMIIPKTSDGRVVFIIPWEGKVLLGTTDTPVNGIATEPMPLESEVAFLLETGNQVLDTPIHKHQIESIFSGLRPLISLSQEKETKSISREEAILVSDSGLVTMSGGKWSTFRKMAEDLTDKVISVGGLTGAKSCQTRGLAFPGKQGFHGELWKELQAQYPIQEESAKRLAHFYGGEARHLLGKNPQELHSGSGYFREEVLRFAQKEYALSVLDVLARRFRVLFLDLELSRKLVDPVAEVLGQELGWDKATRAQSTDEALELIQSFSHFKGTE